ncbi:MAG: 50S ribosomal protein L24e [Candidatus Korarchaeota archaeon]|nr:50S ribosomal protein L24e [Candidatus Korarchaeota archaeon]NIU83127.1 50S ribosomal protein L24e [Candidatus Thorarchaeota archaeon]NIW13501.1 50S ribosomal protein L24e [Candidatus Thorarchaeota archaeon]NIW51599.1 50S ribosomal protein L24e [Candidatus Korarchaeota archaeon]
MPVCDFCGEKFPRHLGITFIRKDGKKYSFCSKKCKKNFLQFKRDPRKVKWTKTHRELKE